MPKRTNSFPSLCRDKASGRALVYADGHRIYLGKYGTSAARQAYDRFVAEWLANGRRIPLKHPQKQPDAPLTVGELILAYWRFADGYYRKPDGRPTSERANIRLALGPLRKLYGRTVAEDFGPIALEAVRASMIDRDWSRKYVNDSVDRIKRMFGWAVSKELLPPSVHQALKALPGLRKGRSEARETQAVRPVPDRLVDAIREHVAPQVWAMVELQRLTGMRPGEVVIMRAFDLDTSGKVWLYRPVSHKTEHHEQDRVIALGPQAQTVLRPWLKPNLTGYLFSPREAAEQHNAKRRGRRTTPLWPSHVKQQAARRSRRKRRTFGDHYSVDTYRRAIQRACDVVFPPPAPLAKQEGETLRAWAARLSAKQRNELAEWQREHRWHPHQLRHYAATRIRKEYGLEVARAVLGHRSAAVTEIYAEMDNDLAVNVMGKIG